MVAWYICLHLPLNKNPFGSGNISVRPMDPIDLCIFLRSSSIVIMEVGRSSTMQLSMTRFHCIDVLGTQLIDSEDFRRRPGTCESHHVDEKKGK